MSMSLFFVMTYFSHLPSILKFNSLEKNSSLAQQGNISVLLAFSCRQGSEFGFGVNIVITIMLLGYIL